MKSYLMTADQVLTFGFAAHCMGFDGMYTVEFAGDNRIVRTDIETLHQQAENNMLLRPACV